MLLINHLDFPLQNRGYILTGFINPEWVTILIKKRKKNLMYKRIIQKTLKIKIMKYNNRNKRLSFKKLQLPKKMS